MNRFQTISTVLLLWPAIVVGQGVTPTGSDGLQDAPANPPVLLQPMRQNTPMDMSLIDDVCRQNQRRTQVYRLQHAAVADVAQALNEWLQQKLKSNQARVDGFICNAPIIIVPQAQSNSLVISTTDAFSYLDDVEKMIRQLDRIPATIQVNAVIKRTSNGKTEILAAPTILVLENTTGSVTVDQGDSQLTLEVTTRLIDNPADGDGPDARAADKHGDIGPK